MNTSSLYGSKKKCLICQQCYLLDAGRIDSNLNFVCKQCDQLQSNLEISSIILKFILRKENSYGESTHIKLHQKTLDSTIWW